MDDTTAAAALLARLVAFDTTSRNSNAALMGFVAEGLRAQGVAVREQVDAATGKVNLHAIIGPRVADGIALSGHVDCVPVDGQAWLADPFVLRRENGRLIGRGAVDMKGFCACVLASVPMFLAAGLRRPVHILLTFDEETTLAGVKLLAPSLGQDSPPPGAVIVGEPTMLAPMPGHKGMASWNASVTGVTGHSSRTDTTANALHAAAEAVAWLAREQRRLVAEGARDARYTPPYSTAHCGTFAAGTIMNIVPDRAGFAFEFRTLPGDAPGPMLARLQAFLEAEVLPGLRAVDPAIEFTFAERCVCHPLDLPDGHPLTGLLEGLTGQAAAARASYGTEAGTFQRAGIPAIVCGPGSIAQAHLPEEWIAESQVADCMGLMRRVAGHLAA
ncbi:acetylornithine deacetylase [Humitalea sp. 24SJ18S-53]|uniref:acetylornithine deacetylase n=1 Tax=Humitalea sp. 24SJ18S-53 TaxID=3422307 RepID=UPI003D66A9A8